MEIQTVSAENARRAQEKFYVAAASELGFPPGCWPRTLNTTLGNGMPFYRRQITTTDDGEIAKAIYHQFPREGTREGFTRLDVLND